MVQHSSIWRVVSHILPRLGNPMASVRLPWFLFAAILLIASISWWHAYPEMPERIASHFSGAGVPNGWMTKDQFFTLNAFLVAMAVFTGLFPPFLISKTDPSLINLPNKEYWLAPRQHAATAAYFRLWFAWFACGLLFFVALVLQLVVESNRSASPRIPNGPFIALLVGFLVFTAGCIVALHRRFSNAEADKVN